MTASTPHNSYGFPRISRAYGATSEETRISDSVLRTCHSMLCSLSNAPNVLAPNTYRRLPRIDGRISQNESVRTVPVDSSDQFFLYYFDLGVRKTVINCNIYIGWSDPKPDPEPKEPEDEKSSLWGSSSPSSFRNTEMWIED